MVQMETQKTYFLISRYFCQFGIFLFSKSKARHINGSPKKPTPTKKVVPLTTISEVIRIETAKTGKTMPASLKRGASLGKGAVGDKALEPSQCSFLFKGFLSHLLGKALPSICNVSHDMHDWPHFSPHGIFHWLFGLVMMNPRCATCSRRLSLSSSGG